MIRHYYSFNYPLTDIYRESVRGLGAKKEM